MITYLESPGHTHEEVRILPGIREVSTSRGMPSHGHEQSSAEVELLMKPEFRGSQACVYTIQ